MSRDAANSIVSTTALTPRPERPPLAPFTWLVPQYGEVRYGSCPNTIAIPDAACSIIKLLCRVVTSLPKEMGMTGMPARARARCSAPGW